MTYLNILIAVLVVTSVLTVAEAMRLRVQRKVSAIERSIQPSLTSTLDLYNGTVWVMGNGSLARLSSRNHMFYVMTKEELDAFVAQPNAMIYFGDGDPRSARSIFHPE